MAKIAKKVVDVDAQTVVFSFNDNEKLVAKYDKLSDAMKIRLGLHGLSQKIGDSYASCDTVVEAKLEAKAVYGNLQKDVWSDGRSSDGGILAEAIARIRKLDIAKVAEKLENATDEEKTILRKNERIKATIETIRGERATAKLDTLEDDEIPGF